MTSRTPRTVIYVRQSLDRDGKGLAVERQLEACQKLARKRGWTVGEVFTDNDRSATTGKVRPDFERLLASKPDRIICWHTDRLCRVTRDLERVIDLGAPVFTVTAGDIDLSTPSGLAVARTITAWATYEGQHKSERQRASNIQRARSGKPHGGGWRSFGYEADGVTLVPTEADALRRAMDDALAGVPLAHLAKRLTDAGLVSSRPNKHGESGWTPEGLRSAMVSPRYAGIRVHKGEVIGDAAWPAIIDRETHLALRTMLTDPSRKKGPGLGRTPANLLSGIGTVVCAECISSVHGSSDRRGLIYTCRGKHFSAPREQADRAVMDALVALLSDPETARELLADPTDSQAVKDARADITKARRKLSELVALHDADVIDAAQLADGSKLAHARIEAADKVLAASASHRTFQGLALGTKRVAAQVEALDLDRRRALVGSLLMAVFYRRASRWVAWDAAEHVQIGRRFIVEGDPMPVTEQPLTKREIEKARDLIA